METQTASEAKKQTRGKAVRVLIVIGRPKVRFAIKQGLAAAPGIEIVGEATDWQGWLVAASELTPDVALVGAPVLTQFPSPSSDSTKSTPLLAAMPEYLDAYLSLAVDAGALGYVLEDANPLEIAAALRLAATGQAQWASEDRICARRWHEDVGLRWRSLTEREREVLRLLAKGMDTAAVANALILTPKTVEHPLSHGLEKRARGAGGPAGLGYPEELPPSIRGGGETVV